MLLFAHRMPAASHSNLYPHEDHGLLGVLRWKLMGARMRSPLEGFQIETAAPNSPRAHLGNMVTWIGHSSFALHFGADTLLLDPVLSDYCAPFPVKRLRRTAPPGAVLAQLAEARAVLITHNHYDHLDRRTILQLPPAMPYFVPAGLGWWFKALGRANVREFSWWESAEWGETRITCVPAQHFSSRTFWDRNRTLWCGWVIERAGLKIYAAGDTGYCPVFREIGQRFGPVDLSLIPIGAYEPRWFMKPMHVNPEEAVQVHLDVRSRRSIACHWGTFCLTDEPMDEPPKRLREALGQAGVKEREFLVLKIGETVPIAEARP